MSTKDQLDRIEGKVDRLDERLDRHDVHLAEYNEQLKIHIKRTNILEVEVKSILKHVNMINGALKLIASVGIITAIVKLLQQ